VSVGGTLFTAELLEVPIIESKLLQEFHLQQTRVIRIHCAVPIITSASSIARVGAFLNMTM
jgi:hypothetical protein